MRAAKNQDFKALSYKKSYESAWEVLWFKSKMPNNLMSMIRKGRTFPDLLSMSTLFCNHCWLDDEVFLSI